MPNARFASPEVRAHHAATRPTIALADGGAWVELKAPALATYRPHAVPRGPIRTFTRKSRHRLQRLFNCIDRDQITRLPLFVTLTYPEQFPVSAKDAKPHLFSFVKRLLRRFKRASIIWRLEYQQRGAPHFHLMVFGIPFLPWQEWATAWYEIVRSEDPRHLSAGCQFVRCKGWGQANHYVAKYLAKVGGEITDETPGRFWGVANRAALPVRVQVVVIAWETFYRCRRVLRKRAEKLGFGHGRMTRWAGCSQFLRTSIAIEVLAQATDAPRNLLAWPRQGMPVFGAVVVQEARHPLT